MYLQKLGAIKIIDAQKNPHIVNMYVNMGYKIIDEPKDTKTIKVDKSSIVPIINNKVEIDEKAIAKIEDAIVRYKNGEDIANYVKLIKFDNIKAYAKKLNINIDNVEDKTELINIIATK